MWNEIPPNHWLETENLVIDAGYYLRTSVDAGNPLGLDVESTGLNTTKDVPILISFSDGIERFTGYFDRVARNNWIESLLLDPGVVKVGTNIKFDRHMCANAKVDMIGPFRDTVVMDWLYNENRWNHGLKDTALDHLGLQMREFKEVFPMRKARKGMLAESAGEAINRIMADPATAEEAKEYSGTDPYASVLVHNFLAAELQKIQMLPGQNMWEYFCNVEVPFTDVLWNLERRGFKIHAGQLFAQVGPITQTMTQLQGELAQMAGWIVNPNSPKQLQKLFFQQLQMRPLKMTKGGKSGVKQASTDDEVLGTWIGTADPVAAPFAERILGFREVSKIKGTYIDGLTERMDANLRIHSTLNQTGAVTGRISSSDPNLQNIPRPATDKFHLRSSFIAEPGMVLVVLDYDQLEMKLMAHFCLHKQMTVSVPGSKGKMIGQIVNGQWTGEVYSYDTGSHKKVVRQVTDHFRNGLPVGEAPYRGGLEPEDWVVIRHEGAPWRKLIITPEHQVYTPTGKEPVSSLVRGDCLMHEEPWLRGYARQVLIGSLLGDGGFKRSKSDTGDGYFHSAAFYHGSAQKEYFDFKLGILTPFVHSHTFDGLMHRAKVTASFQIEELHRAMCGKRKGIKSKRPTTDILKQINEQGLAIWYLDDGGLQKDPRCSPTKGFSANIANSRITEKEIEFLNKKFGLRFKKWSRGMGLSGPSAERFFSIIAKWVPTCMNYKLPSYWRHEWVPEQLDLEQHDATPVKIIEIRKGNAAKDPMGFGSGSKFDITVEDTHNYFAQGILVSNSGDEKMVQAINNGQDLHCFSVSLMFGENYDEVLAAKKSKKPDARQQMLKDKRQSSKSAGFGVIYGIGADALAKQLTVELKRKMVREEAQGILRSYFDSFQGVKEFIRQTKERCRQREYVETFLGRRRRLPEINARGGGDRQDDEINAKGVAAMAARQAVNSIIQGTAADIAKLAMIRAEYDPILHDAGARMLLQIHDELIFEVPDSEDCIETVKKRAQEIMEHPFGPVNPFQVPLTCEAKAALCWSEAK